MYMVFLCMGRTHCQLITWNCAIHQSYIDPLLTTSILQWTITHSSKQNKKTYKLVELWMWGKTDKTKFHYARLYFSAISYLLPFSLMEMKGLGDVICVSSYPLRLSKYSVDTTTDSKNNILWTEHHVLTKLYIIFFPCHTYYNYAIAFDFTTVSFSKYSVFYFYHDQTTCHFNSIVFSISIHITHYV